MRLKDTATRYGWISIQLHWITAILILYLLYLGNTIGTEEGIDRQQALDRHISVAITAYVFLLGRVVWRFFYSHPGPTDEQRGWAFRLATWTHYSMVVAIALMLVTGPLTQFSYGRDINVFNWFVISTPIEASFGLAAFLHNVHTASAVFIFCTLIFHIGGVYKHTAFNQDGTLAKMIIPGRQSPETDTNRSPASKEGKS